MRFAKCVIVQNKNRMVNPLDMAERLLIANAAFCIPNIDTITRPSIKNKGAPGECTTSNLAAPEINSPQSQKLTVASFVIMYTVQAIRHIAQPMTLLILL